MYDFINILRLFLNKLYVKTILVNFVGVNNLSKCFHTLYRILHNYLTSLFQQKSNFTILIKFKKVEAVLVDWPGGLSTERVLNSHPDRPPDRLS